MTRIYSSLSECNTIIWGMKFNGRFSVCNSILVDYLERISGMLGIVINIVWESIVSGILGVVMTIMWESIVSGTFDAGNTTVME